MTEFYSRKPGSWTWELESTLLFMMTSFLKSRTEAGLPSNEPFYDEDVNVYLAGLLASYVNPGFMEGAGRYISPFDIDVAEMARLANARARYTIYKVNADHLILAAGIFETDASPAERLLPTPTAREAISRGQAYYQLAASYGQSLARRTTATVEVLRKLARGFEAYVTILNHLRGEYFNLIERIGEGAMHEIHRGIDLEARRTEHRRRVDRLLDLYNEWLRSREAHVAAEMRQLVELIRTEEPDFEFQLPGDD